MSSLHRVLRQGLQQLMVKWTVCNVCLKYVVGCMRAVALGIIMLTGVWDSCWIVPIFNQMCDILYYTCTMRIGQSRVVGIRWRISLLFES